MTRSGKRAVGFRVRLAPLTLGVVGLLIIAGLALSILDLTPGDAAPWAYYVVLLVPAGLLVMVGVALTIDPRPLAARRALAAFLLVPPYLEASVGPPQAFTLQEAADLLTPLVVIPLAWLVFDLAGGLGADGARSRPSTRAIRLAGPIGTRGIQRTGRESRWEAQ